MVNHWLIMVWLVVSTNPSEKMSSSMGRMTSLFHEMENNPFMIETTNQHGFEWTIFIMIQMVLHHFKHP